MWLRPSAGRQCLHRHPSPQEGRSDAVSLSPGQHFWCWPGDLHLKCQKQRELGDFEQKALTSHSKITIVVNFYIVSEYSSPPPTLGSGEKIIGGPIYPLERVREILRDGVGLQLWTRDCVKDVANLGWDHKNVIELIRQLERGHYIDSEWCNNGRGALAACDAYAISLMEWIDHANKAMRIEYFVKFAINKLGTMVLTISCHA